MCGVRQAVQREISNTQCQPKEENQAAVYASGYRKFRNIGKKAGQPGVLRYLETHNHKK